MTKTNLIQRGLKILIQNRNKYKGEPLLVVGTGGSLKEPPLEQIKMKSFSMNRIGLLFDQTEWRPDFFFCITYRVKKSPAYREDVYKVIRTGVPSFIGNRINKHIFGYKNIHYVDTMHIGKKFLLPKKEYWFHDISDNAISVYSQSLFSVMQIGVYMGFNPIYLVGVDGYKPSREEKDINHFDERYETPKQRHNLQWFHEYGLEAVASSHNLIYKGTRAQGVDVFDATLVDNNNPYPKIDIKELM